MLRAGAGAALLLVALSAPAAAQPAFETPPPSDIAATPPGATPPGVVQPLENKPVQTPDLPQVPVPPQLAQPVVSTAATPAAQPAQSGWLVPHYDKGFVLVSTPDEGGMPFRLVLNHVSQFKYTNSMATNSTYTDHNGVVHDVQQRNDIQLARDVFYFSGFVVDRKLEYNILIFTSTATRVATAAGYAGYTFTRGFALRAGYFSLPSTRAMTGTYPFFHGTDRSMATNYFRPGFTQGVWGEGEPLDGFHYLAMLGNSLNTLDIKSANIDNRYAASATVWYDHNDFGKPRQGAVGPRERVDGGPYYRTNPRLFFLSPAGHRAPSDLPVLQKPLNIDKLISTIEAIC